MKKRFCILLLAALLILTGCGIQVEETEKKFIAVVSKEDGGAFWNTVLIGAEDAALENGYGLTFRGPAEPGLSGLEEQRKIVELALENNASAIVLAAAGAGYDDLLIEAHNRQIPVVALDSGIYQSDLSKLKGKKQSPVVASVYLNNRKAAALAAESLYKEIRQDIILSRIPYAVGILQHDGSATGMERTQGFISTFTELADGDPETKGKFRFLVEACTSGAEDAYVKALHSLKRQGARGIFLTNQFAVDQVYEEIRGNRGSYAQMVFVGFDSGKRQISWIRDPHMPRLVGSVAQDAYLMGYKAVTQCVNALEARGVTAFVEIPGAWYDRENIEEMIGKQIVFE